MPIDTKDALIARLMDAHLTGEYCHDFGPCVLCGARTCMQLYGQWRHACACCIRPGGWAYAPQRDPVADVASALQQLKEATGAAVTACAVNETDMPAPVPAPVRGGAEQFQVSRRAFGAAVAERHEWARNHIDDIDQAHAIWIERTGLYWAKPSSTGSGFEPSYPGEVGVARFAHMRARAGHPGPFPPRGGEHAELLAKILDTKDQSEPLLHDFTFLRTVLGMTAGWTFATYDVQAQYLAASRCDIGSGDPVMIDINHAEARAMAAHRPGFVQLAQGSLPDNPKLYGLSGRAWKSGTWLPTPVWKYVIRDAGVDLKASRALIWMDKTRLLDQWGNPYREILSAYTGSRDRVPTLLCTAAKMSYQQFLGGMLRSDTYTLSAHIPDAAYMVEAIGWANQWRNWNKAILPAGMAILGGRRDSTWVVRDSNLIDAQLTALPGLPTVAPDEFLPGRLRLERWGVIDQAVMEAYQRGLPSRVNVALKNAHEAREGA